MPKTRQRREDQPPLNTDMDKMPLQTLQVYKPKIEKPKPEIVIEELSIELEKVRKNYGVSVQSKRQNYLDYNAERKQERQEEEVEMSIKEREIEDERMKNFLTDTRTLIDYEIKHYKKAYENVLKEYHCKDEYCKNDQESLKNSDKRIEKNLTRINRLEKIRNSLDKEIKVLIKNHEKLKKLQT